MKLVGSILSDIINKTLITRFSNPFGIILLSIATLFISFVVSKLGFPGSIIVLIGLVGLALILITISVPQACYFLSILISFFVFYIERLFSADIPVSIITQLLLLMAIFGILVKNLKYRKINTDIISNPIAVILLIIFAFIGIQGLNPEMDSIDGWLISFKGTIFLFLPFFIAYTFFDDINFLKYFIIFWISLATITALYSCYQEWFGLPKFEENWIRSDQMRFRRIFIKGRFRKFSILSDPAACGIFLAASGVFTLVFGLNQSKIKDKVMIILCALIIFTGMSYTGTRTAFAMVPAGLIFYGLLTITKKSTLVFLMCFILIFAFIIFGPIYGNATIHRIRTTFNSDDPSLNVRDVNRKAIQPYIYSHPIGGGLQTTGTGGLKYNPKHTLAGFPPDSGYLKIALELGWVGLLFYCSFLFIILRVGIKNYYRSKNLYFRKYYAAFLAFYFTILIGLYAQVIIEQIPMAIIFYSSVAFIVKMKKLESHY